MEKTLTIDGQEVKFKVSGGTTTRYRANFGRDMFVDLLKMTPIMKEMEKGLDIENLSRETLERLDFDVFINFIWVFAKTADSGVPDKQTWLDEFDEFPVLDIFLELQPLLEKSLALSKKKTMKNHPATKRQ